MLEEHFVCFNSFSELGDKITYWAISRRESSRRRAVQSDRRDTYERRPGRICCSPATTWIPCPLASLNILCFPIGTKVLDQVLFFTLSVNDPHLYNCLPVVSSTMTVSPASVCRRIAGPNLSLLHTSWNRLTLKTMRDCFSSSSSLWTPIEALTKWTLTFLGNLTVDWSNPSTCWRMATVTSWPALARASPTRLLNIIWKGLTYTHCWLAKIRYN